MVSVRAIENELAEMIFYLKIILAEARELAYIPTPKIFIALLKNK